MVTTLLPFLYQTRTLLRAGARPQRAILTVSPRSLHTCRRLARRPRDDDLDNIPFLWDEKAEQAYKDELAAKSGRRNAGDTSAEDATSTITPAEERTFRDIFANIARGSVARAASAAPASSEAVKKTQSRILDILRDAAGEGDRQTGSPAAGASTTADDRPATDLDTDAESIPDWMMKYPPSLRKSARAAFDSLGPRRTQPLREEKEKEEEEDIDAGEAARHPAAQHQALRDQAIQRMDGLLRECQTDFEVWDLLESEVFSMARRLGITDPPPPVSQSTEPPAAPQKDVEQGSSPSAALELSIETHGPLYSVHLLQCLRALDGAFSRPSPLALSMLPRIRELGLASYVLGASTPFYNELCAILWRRHGDVRGVIALLREMMYVGLRFDQDTLDLVHEMETALDALGQDDSRPFSKVLATMPDYSLDVQSQLAKLANKVEAAVQLR